ncbi:hypothetical protein [Erythrobacter sp. SG61-1L]|uniref:hypothetical protein n=1 Tax=Erythrobacter sp. SG61-1L TaxID=1603897 RepID=UPI0009EBEFD4|nr:hypothetical protein [Erythrobacter sp. SG61-1L]
MARRANPDPVGTSPAACMQRKRQALSAAGFVQCKLQIPESFGQRLKYLKLLYKMRGLDSVASAMIRKAMANCSIDELIAPPPPRDYDRLRQIALHIPNEHYAFLKAVAHRNRGINLGIALETIGSYVTDLNPAPLQLSLLEKCDQHENRR